MFISINLVIRFLLELILLASLGIWGYHFAGGTFSRIVLTAGLPLTGAIILGLFISPKARISLPVAAVVFTPGKYREEHKHTENGSSQKIEP